MAISLRTPLVLVNDEDLVRVSRDSPGYRFEREEDGTIIVSPTHTKGGAKSGEAFGQLWLYAKRVGGKAFDSNTGFAIGPGKRLKCPDASWVSAATIDSVPTESEDGFWPLSPDLAIEVKSDTDDFPDTVVAIEIYRERGSSYAVAINPETREVQERGKPPHGLVIDFDAIIDA